MSLVYCKIPSNDIEWPDPAGKPEGRGDEMKNYVMLDGQKIKLSETFSSLLRAVVGKKKEEKKNPLARKERQDYWYINDSGKLQHDIDKFWFADNVRYDNGNYCTDVELMKQRALHETLNRLLWRHREILGKDRPWDGEHQHWYIVNHGGEFTADFTTVNHIQGVVYFPLRDNAVDAINSVVTPFMKEHPEFVW